MGSKSKKQRDLERGILNADARPDPRRTHIVKDPMPGFAKAILGHPMFRDFKTLVFTAGGVPKKAKYQHEFSLAWEAHILSVLQSRSSQRLLQGIERVETLSKVKSKKATKLAMEDLATHMRQAESAYFLLSVLEGMLSIEHEYSKWIALSLRTSVDDPPPIPSVEHLRKALFGHINPANKRVALTLHRIHRDRSEAAPRRRRLQTAKA